MSDRGTSTDDLTVTGHAQYDAWWAKTSPPVEQLRSDVWSVPVPVPDNPIRYTLCYLLFGADRELVVVDPGWDAEPGWAALQDGLALAGSSSQAVTGIVVTHVHPDHHGLSARLAAAGGAWIAMHPAERNSLPGHAYPRGSVDSDDARWLFDQGVPDDAVDSVRMSETGMESFRAMAEPTVLLDDGDLVPLPGRTIRAVWTPGHTPGHLCLHDESNDLLLTGDHILPRISPNVGLQPHSAAPPLGGYLNSLSRLGELGSPEVLPAHEWRFRGLALRTEQLRDHHRLRCDEIIAVLTEFGSCTAWQVTRRLSWSRGWAGIHGFQRRAALAETLAHLAYLAESGRAAGSRPAGRPTVYSVVS